MKDFIGTLLFVAFTLGIAFGGFIQSYWQRPVITALAASVVARESRIQEQNEDLLWYTQELVFFQDGVARLQEQQEANNILIMKVEDFYKIDLMAAKKGGSQKLEKLVVERVKQYRGMGGD